MASVSVDMGQVIEAGRFLGQHSMLDSSTTNTQRIEAVTGRSALTAAGVCAPFTVDYSMDAVGTVARPVRDSLPQFVADRGGVQFRRDVDATGSGPISASGTWTLAQDANPGSDTKPIWDVPCAPTVSAEVQAVTLGLRFSNITARFDPEAMAANTQAAMVAHARYAELLLLKSMYAQCTATFVESFHVGISRDFLVVLDKSIAYMRSSRRLGDDVRLRLIAPRWLLDAIRADLVRALHTADAGWLMTADSQIEQWFSTRGVEVTWALDNRAAADQPTGTGLPTPVDEFYTVQSGSTTIPGFPTQAEFLLFAEGAFVYMDGGSLDIGVVRDQQLVQTNRYVQFSETFEGVYRKGVEAVRGLCEVQVRGGSAGTVDTSGFTD